MATIKSVQAQARESREYYDALIKAKLEELRVLRMDKANAAEIFRQEIEMIRSARNAKIDANKAKREGAAKARQEAEDRLRKQAMEAAAKKAKEWAAKCHPDHGGTNDGFRAAYAVWKDLEALARQ